MTHIGVKNCVILGRGISTFYNLESMIINDPFPKKEDKHLQNMFVQTSSTILFCLRKTASEDVIVVIKFRLL